MKIVGKDNYDRESVADVLHSTGYVDKDEAQKICDKLNAGLGNNPGTFYMVVEDNYRLWRGMEDLA